MSHMKIETANKMPKLTLIFLFVDNIDSWYLFIQTFVKLLLLSIVLTFSYATDRTPDFLFCDFLITQVYNA